MMIYIQFRSLDSAAKRPGLGKKFLKILLTSIFSEANPDFEDRIDSVAVWLLEFTDETNPPTREIGLDRDSRVILKMPDERNSGYWTDNILTLDDFRKHFQVEMISSETFERDWQAEIKPEERSGENKMKKE